MATVPNDFCDPDLKFFYDFHYLVDRELTAMTPDVIKDTCPPEASPFFAGSFPDSLLRLTH